MEFTEPELKRWLWLRAIEWANWPTFISQPLAPVLFIFLWWPYVIAAIFIVDVLWAFIRYAYVSTLLATVGVFFVVWLKWPAAIGSAIYLFIHRSYVAGIIALLWPLLAGFICIPGQVGRVELAFAKKIGYVDQSVEL